MTETIVRTVRTFTQCVGDCAPHDVISWLDVHSGVAAWVQAILIPLTIVATLAGAILPSVVERRRRQLLLLRSATEVAAVAAGMFGVLRHVAQDKALRGANMQRIDNTYVSSQLEAISAFPVNEMDNKIVTGQLQLIGVQLRGALSLLPAFNNAIQSNSLSREQEIIIIGVHDELVAAHGIIAAEAGVKTVANDGNAETEASH